MNMAGVSATWDQVQAAKLSIAAGMDMLCMPCELKSLDDLAKRDQMNKQRANGKKQYNKKPKKQEPTMDEAMAKLLARFGK